MTNLTASLENQVDYYDSLPYIITIDRRDDQGTYYVARVVELPDLIMTGDTLKEAHANLLEVKRDWIKSYLELGNKMPVPLSTKKYSGQIRLRIPPSLHRVLTTWSEVEGVSLNQYMTTILSLYGVQGKTEKDHQLILPDIVPSHCILSDLPDNIPEEK